MSRVVDCDDFPFPNDNSSSFSKNYASNPLTDDDNDKFFYKICHYFVQPLINNL